MKTILPKSIRSYALALIAVLSLGTSIIPAPVSAAETIASNATTFISADRLSDVKRRQNYYWLRACIQYDDIDKTTSSELSSWEFFKGNGDENLAIGGIYGAGGDAMWSCSHGENVERAFGYLGYTNPRVAFCSLGGAQFDGSSDYDTCIAGAGANGDHYWDNNMGSNQSGIREDFECLIKDGCASRRPDNGVAPIPTIESMNDAMHFIRYYESLVKGCKMTLSGEVVSAARKDELDVSAGNKYLVPIVDSTGKIGYQVGIRAGQYEYVPFVAIVTFNGDSHRNNMYDNTGNMDVKTCGELAQGARDYADRYSRYVSSHPDDAAADTDRSDEASGDSDNAPVCSAGALGWILCPLSEAMVGAIEGIAALLENLLIFQPLTTSEQGKAIKTIWGLLLGIANAGLIIAFLVVVFSQATSIGISNYGIKKLLPRVIAAAILMNLSFYICAAAVDISNILGVSVKSIVDAGLAQLSANNVNPELRSGAGVGDWIATSAVGLMAAAIAVATGAIFLLLPVLISAVMAIFTALIIIAARQVLITLLIIVAPLAILAWILPNTEQWFTRWRKLFTTLLLMFPMVMAIFYGSVLVSSVTLSAAGDTGTGLNDFTVKLLAFLVLIVPLFSLPFVIKSVGGILDRLGVIVNNRNKGVVDRTRKASQGMYDARKDTRRMSAFGSGKLNKINPLAANMRRQATRDHRRGLRKGIAEENSQEYIAKKALEGGQGRLSYSGRMVNSSNASYIAAVQASAQATVDKQDRQSIANREILIRAKYNSEDLIVEAGREFQNAVRSNDETAARAAQNILLNSGTPGLDTLSGAVTSMEAGGNFDDKVKLKEGVKKDLNAAGLKPKQNALATWSYDDRTLAAITVDGGTYAGLNDGELVGQTADNIGIAVDKGVISAAKAQSLLDNASLQGALNDKKRGHLQRAISGTPPAAGGGGTP